jgi:hypothetical protein
MREILFRGRRLAAPCFLSALALLALSAGCGSVKTVKGGVIRVDSRTLGPDIEGYRLDGKGGGLALLRKVALCPVQERRTFREVEVSTQSGALAATQGIGCGITKIAEIGYLITGSPGNDLSNCRGRSVTDRRPTGRKIKGPWKTVRRKSCGKTGAVPPGGTIRVTFLRNRSSKKYPVGPGGAIRFSEEDLVRLRIFFTILRDMEIEARYQGRSWVQKITLE